MPQAATLVGWARELGIPIGNDARDGLKSSDLATTVDAGARPEDCLRALAVKGFAAIDAIATAAGTTTDTAKSIVERLVEEAAVEPALGAYRLTSDGHRRYAELLDEERTEVGAERAAGWLDAFVELDRATKETVTAWQLRAANPGAEPEPNDHADEAYDAAVLERLGRLAGDADDFLANVAATSPRFGTYRRRLARAAAAARAGDGRFVASPRVDSFHGAWFELHEELIRLAGRTRETETAAGRA